jgi:5,10-methylenetetrahydromethanopterin reductase
MFANAEPAIAKLETLQAHAGPPGRRTALLAALAPRMLNLAGEQADGTVLWMTGPATVPTSSPVSSLVPRTRKGPAAC